LVAGLNPPPKRAVTAAGTVHCFKQVKRLLEISCVLHLKAKHTPSGVTLLRLTHFANMLLYFNDHAPSSTVAYLSGVQFVSDLLAKNYFYPLSA